MARTNKAYFALNKAEIPPRRFTSFRECALQLGIIQGGLRGLQDGYWRIGMPLETSTDNLKRYLADHDFITNSPTGWPDVLHSLSAATEGTCPTRLT